MYHSEKVCDGDFSILLEYLEGLQGRSRSLTIDKAQKVISAGEDTINTETVSSGRNPFLSVLWKKDGFFWKKCKKLAM
ncbi:hypothetical protein LSH36_34g06032 [Paralvinella palmiformis]|uniref:WKF domain-containing protein n=1 Tax=Paralvinella palmiformis TaxID=53620 RepID=A0AAD9KAH3_9ANNE|nr:hypothetical protein LSH36_34g06032 [Paralvinella palmiformis]